MTGAPGHGPHGRAPGGSGRGRWIVLAAGFAVLVAVIAVQHYAGGQPTASPSSATSAPPTSAPTDQGSSSPGRPSPTSRPPSPTGSTVPIESTGPTGSTGTVESQTLGDTPYLMTATPASTARVPTSGPSRSTVVPSAVLPTTDDWQVVGYQPGGAIVRYRPATGAVTITPVPFQPSGGGYSLVLTPRAAVLRPMDVATGYAIPIHDPATELTGRLAGGGPTLPGPTPGRLWVSGAGGVAAPLLLVNSRGQPLGPRIDLASIDPNDWPAPDGAGYALITGVGGAYDARPTGLSLVTHGTVLAAGPTGYLVYECNAAASCGVAVVSRSTGSHHRLHGLALDVPRFPRTGVLSPGGSFAAFDLTVTAGRFSRSELHLVDLRSGLDRVVTGALDDGQSRSLTPAFAFSPDDQWLVFATLSGRLAAMNTANGLVTMLPTTIPPVTALAVQSAG